MPETLRVALCDDHGMVRSGLRRILEEQSDVEVVGEAATVRGAVTLAESAQPDVFIMDLTLPDGSGLSAVRQIRQVSPATSLLVLTMHDEVEYLREAFTAGAHGYLIKEAADLELLLAVRTVAAGRRYVHPTLGASLLGGDPPAPKARAMAPLSPREVEILKHLALGHTNAEVAKLLTVSARTVDTHRAHICQKLGVRSRAELARIAREAHLIP